uniref:NIF3-like protein 1 n=1 Tax=Gasterosteus aculeatus aculeatus TaxID=481459 RepID=G3NXP5_GASAC
MSPGCRSLSRTFFSLSYPRRCTWRSLTSKAALCSSASAVSPTPPPLSPTPPPPSTALYGHCLLFTGQRASAPRRSPPPRLPPARRFSRSACPPGPMELKEVLQVLEQLAPLSLAESWDNVGLLVEPSESRPVKTVLLTNDLTDAVMDEAEAMSCDLVVSYHPPLFRPIKRLVQRDWKQKLVIRALEARMAIFSPHTSWDSVKGGVNDWLVGGLGSGQVSVLSQAAGAASQSHKLEFTVTSAEELHGVMEELKACGSESTLQHSANRPDNGGVHVSVTCSDSALTPSVQTLLRHNAASHSLSILKLEKPPLPGHGQGRLIALDQPVTVATAVQKMKSHLGLSHLRLALGSGRTPGEMSHHEVLDAAAAGTSVILSDHSNSERGFLAVFREKLAVRLPDSVTVAVSKADRDPLEVV